MTYDRLGDPYRVLVISAEVVVRLFAAAGVDDHECPATEGHDIPLRKVLDAIGGLIHGAREDGYGPVATR
jgi:hypothetical protein